MGGVAIWCMHFIGNRAIIIDQDQPDLQIAYSPAFTAGSFFIPIVFVGIAFATFSMGESMPVLRMMVGGFICGAAICGMHYISQIGILNYTNVFDWRFIVAATVLAIATATVALGIFFHLKSAWTNTWWKRILTSLLLAAAVCGMHWVATVGTNYLAKPTESSVHGGLSRVQMVIIVGVFVRAFPPSPFSSYHRLGLLIDCSLFPLAWFSC
jgi:NO-binding membrane sensor protein with MHYT domain